MGTSTISARSTEFSEVSHVVNHNSRLVSNWEKKLRHEELTKNNINHEWGVRKNIHGGHEFYLIEENKINFKEAVKHPSQALARLMEIIQKVKSAFLQLIRIDVSVRKKADEVKKFELIVQNDINELSKKYHKLKSFGECLVGKVEETAHHPLRAAHDSLAQELHTARNRIIELEHTGSEHIRREIAGLRETVNRLLGRNLELNNEITRHTIQNEEKDRRISLLKNTRDALQAEIHKLMHPAPESTLGHVEEEVKKNVEQVVDEFKEIVHKKPKVKHHKAEPSNNANTAPAPNAGTTSPFTPVPTATTIDNTNLADTTTNTDHQTHHNHHALNNIITEVKHDIEHVVDEVKHATHHKKSTKKTSATATVDNTMPAATSDKITKVHKQKKQPSAIGRFFGKKVQSDIADTAPASEVEEKDHKKKNEKKKSSVAVAATSDSHQ